MPDLTAQDWRKVIEENPDISFRIVSDIVKCVQSENTPNRTGRRPSPEAMSFEELMETLFPKHYSSEPFPVACRALIGSRTQTEFAAAAAISQSHLCRLLNEQRTPDLAVMESLAAAGGVSPSYFVEYRAAALAQALTDFLLAQPQQTMAAMKTFARSG